VEKKDYKKVLKSIFTKSVMFGIAVAVVIYGLDFLFAKQGAGFPPIKT